MNVPWVRVLVGALLVEIVLMVTLVPLSFVDMTLFLVAVPIGAFAFGYLVTWSVLRKVPSAQMLHGTLIGIVATVMYFALVATQPGGVPAAVAVYGAPLFYFSQVTRIGGCAAAGLHLQRRASAAVRAPAGAP